MKAEGKNPPGSADAVAFELFKIVTQAERSQRRGPQSRGPRLEAGASVTMH